MGMIIQPSRFASGGGGGSTPHRYWRFYATKIVSGSATLGMSETYFLDETGTPLVPISVAGNNEVSGYPSSYVHDGLDSIAANFSSGTSPNYYWFWMYDYGTPVSVGYAYCKARWDGGGSQSPEDFEAQWSDDGTTWTTLAKFKSATNWGAGEIRTFNLLTTDRWRLVYYAGGDFSGYHTFTQLEYRGSIGGSDLTSDVSAGTGHGGRALGTQGGAGAQVQYAFTDSITSNFSGSDELGAFIEYLFDAPTTIAQVAMTCRVGGGSQGPINMEMLRSTDQGLTYNHVGYITASAWSSGATQALAV